MVKLLPSSTSATSARRCHRPACTTPILDIGCGQRHLVKLMLADGYDVAGIDVSPEQLALARAVGLDQIQQGDYRLDIPRTCAAIA